MTTSFIPKTLEELGRDLARLPEDSLILAGGTDLVIHMHSRHMRPQALLSLSDVEELRQIVITPELASIGAMATMAQVAAAADGLEDLQALAHAASDVGSPQIRNKGTIGGNVANASPAADLTCTVAAERPGGDHGARRCHSGHPHTGAAHRRQTRHDPGPERGAGPLSHRPHRPEGLAHRIL